MARKTTFFKDFKTVTGSDLPCPKTLSQEDMITLVYMLNVVNGESMTSITNWLGISRQQGYNLLKKADEETLTELENLNYLTLFAKELHALEATRALHRSRVSNLLKIIENGFVDNETGEKREKTGINRDLSEAARLVRDYDKIIIDFKKSFGVIPDKAVNPYGSMRDKAPKDQADQEIYNKSSEQLIGILLDKLMNRPSSLNVLKNIKDESVLSNIPDEPLF
jgi:hypothetical protein